MIDVQSESRVDLEATEDARQVMGNSVVGGDAFGGPCYGGRIVGFDHDGRVGVPSSRWMPM